MKHIKKFNEALVDFSDNTIKKYKRYALGDRYGDEKIEEDNYSILINNDTPIVLNLKQKEYINLEALFLKNNIRLERIPDKKFTFRTVRAIN